MAEASKQGTIEMSDGARICYRLYGGGERVVVLLHGNGEDYTCFSRQIPDFSRAFRVLAIDSRGHGESTEGAGVSILRMADDTAAVLAALGIPKVSLVGFSDGGNVALYFALRYRDRLEKLVLAGANLDPRGVKLFSQLPCEVGYRVCRLLARHSGEARKQAVLLGLMVKEPQIAPSELAAIRVPTLVMAGDRDMIKPEHTALIARSIPGARMRIIAHCDHFLFKNRPVEVNREILAFLAEG